MREGLTQAERDMLEKAKADQAKAEADAAEKELQFREFAAHESEKYGQMIESLILYTMIPASVYRFVRVCEVLKNCFQVACRGEVDSEIINYRWFRVGLEMLKENPHERLDGDAYFNFSDEEQGLMVAALKPFFSYLIKWAKKMLPRHEDTYYIDELEVTIENAIINPMGPQPFDAPSQTEWDFIFERDENIGAVEYTGTVFAGLLRHSKAEKWENKYKFSKSGRPFLPEGLEDEYRLAVHCSRPEYLCERGQFESVYSKVKQGWKASQTLLTGNEPDWESLRAEFRECGAGQEWYILPSAEKQEELRAKLKQCAEQRQEAISAALRPPEPEPPKKDVLHTVGDCLISQLGSLTVSGDYRGIGVAFLLGSLESIIRECLRSKQWGVFGNPLYIKTVIAIQAQSGFSCEKGTEDQSIEGAWKSLSNVLRVYFRSFVQVVKCKKLPDVEAWIKKNPSITYPVEDSPLAPDASGYRGLSASVCGGLFDVSQAIAEECYGGDSDQIANMYADVFPEDVKWYSFPRVQDRSVPLEVRYSPIETAIVEQKFKAPSMDCFRATCRTLVKGLAIANQCGDWGLPTRQWLRTGLQILALNPQGELTYENQHLQYYNSHGCDWVMNAFEPVAIALREWALSMMPHLDADATSEEAECGSGIPFADRVDEIMRSVYRLDNGEDRWTLHVFELVFESTDDSEYYRYKTTTFDQMINSLPPDEDVVELVPVKERESVARIEAQQTGCDDDFPFSFEHEEDTSTTATTAGPSESENSAQPEDGVGDGQEENSSSLDVENPVRVDPWAEFYGQTIFWYRISADGTEIIDISEPDPEDINEYKTYRGITQKATGAREALAFFFASFRDTLKIDREKCEIVAQNEYVEFPKGRIWRSSFDQIKDLKEFRAVQMEPEGKESDKSGKPINPTGKWRIRPLPDEWGGF